jgi:hypothetical protein
MRLVGGGGGSGNLAGEHVDPGLLTLKVASGVAGLEMRTRGGGWASVEGPARGLGTSGQDNQGRRHVVMFAAEQLEDTAAGCTEAGGGGGGGITATRHRVARGHEPRLSLVFELRTHPSGREHVDVEADGITL